MSFLITAREPLRAAAKRGFTGFKALKISGHFKTSVSPPETKIWNGAEWVVQNDIETLRTTISILTTKSAELQSTIDGLNSYVGTMTETLETVTDMVIAFGDAIEKAGFYCSLYSNLNWLKNYLDDSKLKRFDHWLAQWASAPTYTGAFGMWQSSSTGKVSGINGNVDTDIAYKDYPTIIKNAKLNGFTGSGQTPTVPTQPEPLPSVSLKKGDLVKITGTKYYGGQTIPAWVKAKNWYVLQVNGRRVVIDKSEDGKNAICSPVNAADLKLVNAKPTKTVDELAREVIRGLWGNGTDRKNRLTAAGYDYYAVQARVNEILK